MKRKNFDSNNFEKLKEEADNERVNNYSENKDLYESLEGSIKVEINLTGQNEDPSSPNGSTSSSDKIKNSEINQEKIEDKSKKVKICTTPKEKEDKMNEDSIEKKKEAISLNNVKSDEKNMYLLGTKEPVEQFNMLIDSDSEDDIVMKNDNDDQLINFSFIAKINVNQKGYEGTGEDYEINDENNPTYSLPIEDDDKLNPSCLPKIWQIQCND